MSELTRDQVEEWLRLAEAATPGPWQQSRFVDRGKYRAVSENMKQEWRRTEAITVRGPGEVGTPGCNRVGTAVTPEDRALVILSRTAVPALCCALLDTQARLTLALAEVRAGRVLLTCIGESTAGSYAYKLPLRDDYTRARAALGDLDAPREAAGEGE